MYVTAERKKATTELAELVASLNLTSVKHSRHWGYWRFARSLTLGRRK